MNRFSQVSPRRRHHGVTAHHRFAPTAVVAASLALLAGCAAPTPASSPTAQAPQTLTIYAAASLSGVFDTLAAQLTTDNPSITVETNYDGSSTLVTQISEGAPADVFASADTRNMDALAADNLVGPSMLFASNTLRIAVAPGNPLGINTLSDLARPNVISVLCAPQVPCGTASATLLGNAGVTLSPASEEQSVTAVVTKVAEGIADAGLVYATDIAANPDRIEGVTPAGAADVVAHYPITIVSDSAHAAAAQAFIDLVLSPKGQSILAAAGFLAP
ncbi:MAG: molybdate ABC transporter substrate-binding protein [Cryobacterium sp.]|uniref:molybdate ABC transporter substrate-binding protein n=1 Tax=unclassified Cryobacterium TaxID=2649013 RepID=UPI0018CA3F38|nr:MULTISPECIES: molybdate ABC transporter substrate-binding protein [unclassified Cryobacterium]MCY7405537.1 molybdate ABC transporter substrate-binding protein [Cryobacterium sp.]MEC5154427.1 molybdate transport system substrate-binding protein [Cryobacterium sp. CAN_C3]